jgi:hypothetical protein
MLSLRELYDKIADKNPLFSLFLGDLCLLGVLCVKLFISSCLCVNFLLNHSYYTIPLRILVSFDLRCKMALVWS